MARRRRDEEAETSKRNRAGAADNARALIRFAVLTAALVLMVSGIGYGAWRLDQTLRRDGRFALPEEEPGQAEEPIHVEGVQYASRPAVLKPFAPDRGRSIYLINPEERRRDLLQVDWVQDASVRRLWPNRVAITIAERVPVAVAGLRRVAGNGEAEALPLLIDAYGAYLTPPADFKVDLPVLTGLGLRDPLAVRHDKVRRMQLLLKELESWRKQVLEVDAGNPDNLRIVFEHQGLAATLVLGSENYRRRVKHYVAQFDEIRDRLPEDPVLDLRIDDRITIAQ